MAELCLMASNGYPPGLGVVLNPEQVLNRGGSKDLNHFLPYHGPNKDLVNSQSFNSSLHQIEEWKSTERLWNFNHFLRTDLTFRRPALIDFQETLPDSVYFSFGIAEKCRRHERILQLLASGSIEAEDGLYDLSMPNDMMGPDYILYPNIVYPTREFYFNEPMLEVAGDQLQYQSPGIEMNDMLSVMSDLYLSKSTTKSSKQTMLVPYFERKRRARANTDATKLTAEKVGSLKGQEKEKASQKKKSNTRTFKERDNYCNSYLHACESLLSVIVDRKQQGKNTILSLKKSGPQLPQLLTQFSASIAGTGIAVVLSVICRVACSAVPMGTSKLLSTGLGLGLVWLSWAVTKLRDTVITINKSSSKYGEKEEEMMNHLDRNLKDIYFRAVALMAVAVLRLA